MSNSEKIMAINIQKLSKNQIKLVGLLAACYKLFDMIPYCIRFNVIPNEISWQDSIIKLKAISIPFENSYYDSTSLKLVLNLSALVKRSFSPTTV